MGDFFRIGLSKRLPFSKLIYRWLVPHLQIWQNTSTDDGKLNSYVSLPERAIEIPWGKSLWKYGSCWKLYMHPTYGYPMPFPNLPTLEVTLHFAMFCVHSETPMIPWITKHLGKKKHPPPKTPPPTIWRCFFPFFLPWLETGGMAWEHNKTPRCESRWMCSGHQFAVWYARCGWSVGFDLPQQSEMKVYTNSL